MNTTSSAYLPQECLWGDFLRGPATALESTSLIGRCVGGVNIVKLLATSEMSDVYLGRDRRTGDDRVVKICRNAWDDGHRGRSRFNREVALHCKVSSRSIPRIYCSGTYQEFKFLVMEHIPGRSLTAHLAQAQQDERLLAIDEIVAIAIGLVHGLRAIGKAGIVHRDIKPANILLSDSDRVTIIDFGIATTSTNEQFTDTNEVLGTAAYMSPEQWAGHDLDVRSDVYAFGIVLLEMLTGILPSQRCDLGWAVNPDFSIEGVSLPDLRRDAPPELLLIVRRCLRRDRRLRYPDFDAVLHDFRDLRRRMASRLELSAARSHRVQWIDLYVAVILIIVVILCAWGLWG